MLRPTSLQPGPGGAQTGNKGIEAMKTTMQTADTTLDLRGAPNPDSLLLLKESFDHWSDGEVVKVLTDDDCFVGDFLRWCAGRDVEILSLHYPAGGLTELVIRRSGRRQLLSA